MRAVEELQHRRRMGEQLGEPVAPARRVGQQRGLRGLERGVRGFALGVLLVGGLDGRRNGARQAVTHLKAPCKGEPRLGRGS